MTFIFFRGVETTNQTKSRDLVDVHISIGQIKFIGDFGNHEPGGSGINGVAEGDLLFPQNPWVNPWN